MNVEHEAPFTIHELFFSRTNSKGYILSGNPVFQRISGYSWKELLGRPHNIIRHPHMPRGVFHLFWNELEAQRPVSAYVKNRSKDNCYYWVYALALPLPVGFLSIRLKPTSELFSAIPALYQRILERESALNPEQSHELLLEMVNELGFTSYQDFMAFSLMQELDARHVQLNGTSSAKIGSLKKLNALNRSLCLIPGKILAAYSLIAWTPLNLEISAMKLGDAGKCVGVVASTYQKLILEIEDELKAFEAAAAAVERDIKDVTFLLAADVLTSEINDYFRAEEANPHINFELELEHLSTLKGDHLQKIRQKQRAVEETLRNFSESCGKLKSLVIGLEVIRISGKIEIARFPTASDFSNLLDELMHFQQNTNKYLLELQGLNKEALEILDGVD